MFSAQPRAEVERNLLNHYNIQSTQPIEWPSELNDSDSEDDRKSAIRRSRSRYSALERAASDRRTLLPGSQTTRDGRANLVQKDESDPLGRNGSVIGSLKARGLPLDQDLRLRNKFLLSSTTFSPSMFLSQTQSDASTDELVRGLQFLSKSIDQKSASLKLLVETNFERFVRAKATIDNVYTEMRNQGVEQYPDGTYPPSPRNFSGRHSRQVSRQSNYGSVDHRRITSSGSANIQPVQAPSKNALRKETEYGVKGIKGPLLEVSQRAEDVWGPALGGREREASLKTVANTIHKDKFLYELGSEMDDAISRRDYERVIKLYHEARRLKEDVVKLADRVSSTSQPLSEAQVNRILVTGRMWSDLQQQIKGLETEIWKRLSQVQQSHNTTSKDQLEESMEMIGLLLELGVEDNPIWIWLLSRYDNLKNKILAVTERSKVEIEILRRRLSCQIPTEQRVVAGYLRSGLRDPPGQLDTEEVTEFWEALKNYVDKLISPKHGLLAEVLEFWQSARSFMDGTRQKDLPAGYDGESTKHHRLSDAGVGDLSKGTTELIAMICGALHTLFADPPVEDFSPLFTPTANGTAKSPMSAMFSPTDGRIGSIDEKAIPPPSPKKGQIAEDYAFWPQNSNSLSAIHALSKVTEMLQSGAGQIAGIDLAQQTNSLNQKLKNMFEVVRERSLVAIAKTWLDDSHRLRLLEEWSPSLERPNQTQLLILVSTYENNLIDGIQRIAYPNSTETAFAKLMLAQPKTNTIQLLRRTFTESMLAFVTGMQRKATDFESTDEDEWSSMGPLASDSRPPDRSICLLLNLLNVRTLQSEHVSPLISRFERAFSVHLNEESTIITKTILQVDHSLFVAYTEPTNSYLAQITRDAITSKAWEPTNKTPEQVSPYAYAALMALVSMHNQISTTIDGAKNTSIFHPLLHELLLSCVLSLSTSLLKAYSSRSFYTLPALIQATLDTEFIGQTLGHLTDAKMINSSSPGSIKALIEKNSQVQNEIYTELDKRTTNDARAELQKELVGMRGVLKKHRDESRVSFGCFRRVRREDKESRPGAARSITGTSVNEI